MPSKPCLEPRCPEPATYRGRCRTHAAIRDASIQRAGKEIYRTKKWQNTRKRKLFLNPLCERCFEIADTVHHRQDIAEGGDIWAMDNLESLCRSCHSKQTHRDTVDKRAGDRIVILVGKPGVGKSAIRDELGDVGLVRVGPDDFTNRWKMVLPVVDNNPVLLECCRIPEAVERMRRPTFIVKLVCPDSIRRQRLEAQGLKASEVEARMAASDEIDYRGRLSPDLTLETTTSPAEAAQRIASVL